MDQNSSSSARNGQISIHIWAGWLYKSRSIDQLLYNQLVGFIPERSEPQAIAGNTDQCVLTAGKAPSDQWWGIVYSHWPQSSPPKV